MIIVRHLGSPAASFAAHGPWSPLRPLAAVHLHLSWGGDGHIQTCSVLPLLHRTCVLASGLQIVNPVPEVGHHEVLGLDHPLLGLHCLLELLVLLRDGAAPGKGALKFMRKVCNENGKSCLLPPLLGHVPLLLLELVLHQ